MAQLSFSESGNLSQKEIPRLARFVSLGNRITFFAEAPLDIQERLHVRDLWMEDKTLVEPGMRDHIMFDRYPCAVQDLHAVGLRGWWE